MNKPSLFVFLTLISVLMILCVDGYSFDKGRFSRGICVAEVVDQPPFSFMDNAGKPQGFIIDYWRKWSVETGIPVSFKLASWRESLQMVRKGECDVHGGLYRTPEREQFLDYTGPTFPVVGVLIVNANSPYTNLESMAGRTVSVAEMGSSHEYLGTRHTYIKLQTYLSTEHVVAAFLAGEVDGLFGDQHAILYLLNQKGIPSDAYREVPIYEKPLHAAVAKGRQELLTVVSEGMSLIDEKEKAAILNVWFVAEDSIPMGYIVGVTAAGILFLCGAGYLILGSRWRADSK